MGTVGRCRGGGPVRSSACRAPPVLSTPPFRGTQRHVQARQDWRCHTERRTTLCLPLHHNTQHGTCAPRQNGHRCAPVRGMVTSARHNPHARGHMLCHVLLCPPGRLRVGARWVTSCLVNVRYDCCHQVFFEVAESMDYGHMMLKELFTPIMGNE